MRGGAHVRAEAPQRSLAAASCTRCRWWSVDDELECLTKMLNQTVYAEQQIKLLMFCESPITNIYVPQLHSVRDIMQAKQASSNELTSMVPLKSSVFVSFLLVTLLIGTLIVIF